MLIVVSKMKQKYKSPKDPQENDASKEVKKKVIFSVNFVLAVGRKDIVTGEKINGFCKY